MFDRAPSSRRAKSWQPDPGLLSHSRGFATTRWGTHDDGFMVDDIKRTKDGFALDEYAQVPLSPQAVAALKRLQKIAPEEALENDVAVFEAPVAFEVEAWNANAHLPFVIDDYGFHEDLVSPHPAVDTSPSPKADAEASNSTEQSPTEGWQDVLPNAQLSAAPAQHTATNDSGEFNTAASPSAPDNEAATLEANDGEAAEKTSDVHHAESPEAEVNEAQATQAEANEAQANAVSEIEAKAQAQEQAHTKAESHPQEEAKDEANEEAQTQTQTQAQEDPASQSALSEKTATDGLEADLAAEQAVADEPVHAGIEPDVAAQREAEKFAEGLAQGIAQGTEQGLAQGIAQGMAQGITQGESQAREAMQQEVQAQCAVLANVTQELQALLQNPTAFFEPMKRLAMHLAEQIVMAELRTSTHAIEQLIQRCLDELDHPAQGLVVIELHPDDKARLQAQSPELIRGMRLEAVHNMAPGSVRLFANDAVVEDLVTHRLQALAQSMLVDVAAWQANSALAQAVATPHDTESDDVHP